MTNINTITTKDLSHTFSSGIASFKKLGGLIVQFVSDIPNQMQTNRNTAIASYAVVNVACLAIFEFVANRLDPSNAKGKERSYTNIILNGAFAGSVSFACNCLFSKLTHYELNRTALLLITLAGSVFRLLRIRGTSTPEEGNKHSKEAGTNVAVKDDVAATSSTQSKKSDHKSPQATVIKKETASLENNAPVNQTAAKVVEAKERSTDNSAIQGSVQTKNESPPVNQIATKVETAKHRVNENGSAKPTSDSQSTQTTNVPASDNKPAPKDDSVGKSEGQSRADIADADKRGGANTNAKEAAGGKEDKSSTGKGSTDVGKKEAGRHTSDVDDTSKTKANTAMGDATDASKNGGGDLHGSVDDVSKSAGTSVADEAESKDKAEGGALTKSTDWKSITVENAIEDAIKDLSTENHLTHGQLTTVFTVPTTRQKNNNTPKAQVFEAKADLDGQKKRLENAITARNLENLAAAKKAYRTAYERYGKALVAYQNASGSK